MKSASLACDALRHSALILPAQHRKEVENRMPVTVEKGPQLYEGKAKILYGTDDPGVAVMEFKDSLTAFDAVKTGSEAGKGAINNAISALLMGRLNDLGVPTCFIRQLDATHSLVWRVEIVPLEVIVRFEMQGSFCKRYGTTSGIPIYPPLLEIGYKCDALHDPFLNDDAVVAMGLATRDELHSIRYLTICTSHDLCHIFRHAGITLLDLKFEFGRITRQGDQHPTIILADEITPDTCRLVDAKTGEKLDKDLFRFDIGDLGAGYRKLAKKLGLDSHLPGTPAEEVSLTGPEQPERRGC